MTPTFSTRTSTTTCRSKKVSTPEQGELEEGGVAYTTIAALLRLSKTRSDYIVGKALAEAFPREEDWDAAKGVPNLLEQLNAVALVADDVRQERVYLDAEDPEGVQHAIALHFGRLLETVELFAEEIGVDVHDLLTVLVND